MSNLKAREPSLSRSRLAGSILCRLAIFSLVWWSLAETRPLADWPLVVIVVAVSTAFSYALIPAERGPVSLLGLLRFLPFFLAESFRGGVDVAYRSMHPRIPVSPGFLEYSSRLTNPSAQILLTWVVSLLPGTAGVRLQGNRMKIHVLDRNAPSEARLRSLERRIALLFTEPELPKG